MKFEGDTNIQSTTPSFPEPFGLDKWEDWSARWAGRTKLLGRGVPGTRAHCSDLLHEEYVSWKVPAVFLLRNHYCIEAKVTLPWGCSQPVTAQQRYWGPSFWRDAGLLQWLTLARDSLQPGWSLLGTMLQPENIPSPLLPRVWPDRGLNNILTFSSFLPSDWLSCLIPSWHLLFFFFGCAWSSLLPTGSL